MYASMTYKLLSRPDYILYGNNRVMQTIDVTRTMDITRTMGHKNNRYPSTESQQHAGSESSK